jgi:hypothetical protein
VLDCARVLTRPELVAIIALTSTLREKASARLSDSQLVTFIVTAVEVQALQGRR